VRVPPLFNGSLPICICQDVRNNTYACTMSVDAAASPVTATRYCEFEATASGPGLVEFFDLVADPWEMSNGAAGLPPGRKAAMHTQLTALRTCEGSAACTKAGQ
jgi:hypothetical protein